jgi:hypothetical protein
MNNKMQIIIIVISILILIACGSPDRDQTTTVGLVPTVLSTKTVTSTHTLTHTPTATSLDVDPPTLPPTTLADVLQPDATGPPPTSTPLLQPTLTPTVTSSPTPRPTNTPVNLGPLDFTYHISWRLAPSDPAMSIATVTIQVHGGDGNYTYYRDDMQQLGPTFEYNWASCHGNPGSLRVDSGDGQSVRKNYFDNPPCPTPTPIIPLPPPPPSIVIQTEGTGKPESLDIISDFNPLYFLRLIARVVNTGNELDGTGISGIDFSVTSEMDGHVYSSSYSSPPFCIFGGTDNGCNPWVLEDNVYKWKPGGEPIYEGKYYLLVELRLDPPIEESDEDDTYFWEEAQWRATVNIQLTDLP